MKRIQDQVFFFGSKRHVCVNRDIISIISQWLIDDWNYSSITHWISDIINDQLTDYPSITYWLVIDSLMSSSVIY